MNNRQKKEKKLWDKLAKYYDKQVKSLEVAYNNSIHKIKAYLNPGASVHELGCGTGIISLGISGDAKNILATDISENMIQIARNKAKEQNIKNVDFQVGDAYTLKQYPDNSFDTILIFNVLHVLKDPAAVLIEVKRVLKNEGTLLTATDCYAEPAKLPKRILLSMQKLLKKIGLLSYLSFFTKEELEKLIEGQNFTIKEKDVFFTNPVNYFIAAQKNNNEKQSTYSNHFDYGTYQLLNHQTTSGEIVFRI